jgi:DNA-binding CsgD family transcriptional regulator
MAYVQHMSRQEIATELDISPHTVKNQLQRAIKILRAKLKKVSL